jgi:glycine/D-amino acid oxidase-like deaminating enzyme
MKRRTALKLLGAIPLLGTTGFRPRADRVVVIGGGILGTAVAYRLARRGASITLCEQHDLASGASGKSGAWLNAYHSKLPEPYFRLNHLSLLAWHELESEVEGLRINWGGRIDWTPDRDVAENLRVAIERQQGWGYPVRFIGEEGLRARMPSFVVDQEIRAALFADAEGTLNGEEAVGALAAAAEAQGATLRMGCEVRGIARATAGVTGVETSDGFIDADAVVVAAGVDTERLSELVGVRLPLRPAPGLAAWGTSAEPLVHSVVSGPDVTLIPQPGNRYYMSRGYTGSNRGFDYSQERPTDSMAQAEEILAAARKRIGVMDAVTLDRVTVGWRPLPTDGYPVMGFPRSAPGVYPMVSHSGVTLAAILSRLAAIEILDGVSVDLLGPYRVERFA